MNDFEGSYVTTLIAGSDKSRNPPKRVNNYEVSFEPRFGEFPRWTVVDCRWLFAFPRSLFKSDDFVFALPAAEVERLTIGIVHGLQF